MLDFCFVSAIVLSVLDVRAYIVCFSASLDMNQLPEKLYLGQNRKQYVMKEAVIYKILKYRQNRCHTNEERWTENLQYKRGRLKCLARYLFLIFLDNLAVVFF
jgi:hypothetical protein